MIPVDAWHTASVGIDVWLAAIAYGAAGVWVLMTGEEAPGYRVAVAEQMRVAEAIVQGLGYAGEHFRIVDASAVRPVDAVGRAGPAGAGPADPPLPVAAPGPAAAFGRNAASTSGDAFAEKTAAASTARRPVVDPALLALDRALQRAPAATVASAATFAVQPEKRATLDFAIDHLVRHVPTSVPDAIDLAGADGAASASPFGSVVVDTAACTLCLACVGACPEGALADNAELPQLRFVERSCVQCGLCASTCPEDAITLEPRLWLADAGRARRQARVLNEALPFHCIRCAKPFATAKVVEVMLARLGGHAMFQGRAAERLRMCGDCRVIDLHGSTDEVRIDEL